jgi:integrase
MATINFQYRGKSETGNITIRLKHSTSIDYRISSNIVSQKKFWFKTTGKHRKLDELSYLSGEAKNHKTYLEKIESAILSNFKTDFNKGVPISNKWFKRTIDEVANILSTKVQIESAQVLIQKEKEKKNKEEKEIVDKNLIVSAIERVISVEYFDNKNQVKIYKQLLNKITSYQNHKNKRFKINCVTQNFVDEFSAYLMKDLEHQISTTRKHCKSLIHAVKYQKNAFPDVVQLSSAVSDIKYRKQSKSEKRKARTEIVVILNFDELEKIYKIEVPEHLLNTKKIILFGCEFGVRVSDYDKLTKENIKRKGEMEYLSFYNQKTGVDVVIPFNDRIKKYISCFGLPRTNYNKTDDVIINREIKEVCKLAGINEMVQARKSQSVEINGNKVRRAISMKYPKYDVISTHSLRRSFATNYYNILSLFEIRQITGHTNDAQLIEYINQDKDRTEILETMLSKMNAFEKANKPQLNVIKNTSSQN